MVGVRAAARQRRLEAAAGLTLPVGDTLPEESVELPDGAFAERCPVLEDDAAPGLALVGADGGHRAGEIVDQALRPRPAHVDRELGERHRLTARVGGVANRDRLSKVRLVLDPVEVQAKAREQLRVEPALVEQREERRDDPAGSGLAGLR